MHRRNFLQPAVLGGGISRGETFYRIGPAEVPMESILERLTDGVNRLRIQVGETVRHHEVAAATSQLRRSGSVFRGATRLAAAVTDP